MAQFDTLIFDGEGVVIDTEGLWDAAQREFFARRGLEYERDVVKPLLAGRPAVEGMQVLKDLLGIEGDPVDLAAERRDIARRYFGDVAFIDGFEDFFAAVSGAYATCVATSMDVELFALADARLNLKGLFGGRIFTAADIAGPGKPAPDLFLHAAAQLGVGPSTCVVIEDAPNGIEAARRAGMYAVGLATTFEARLLAGADLVVRRFDEIDLARLPAR